MVLRLKSHNPSFQHPFFSFRSLKFTVGKTRFSLTKTLKGICAAQVFEKKKEARTCTEKHGCISWIINGFVYQEIALRTRHDTILADSR